MVQGRLGVEVGGCKRVVAAGDGVVSVGRWVAHWLYPPLVRGKGRKAGMRREMGRERRWGARGKGRYDEVSVVGREDGRGV